MDVVCHPAIFDDSRAVTKLIRLCLFVKFVHRAKGIGISCGMHGVVGENLLSMHVSSVLNQSL